jgi:TctA family transporter
MTIDVPSSAASQAQHTSAAAPPGARTEFELAFFALLGIFGFAATTGKVKRERLAPVLAGSFALAALIVAVSCAGYSSNGSQPPPSQTYTITVTASGTNAPTHTESITLTVP